MFHSRKLLQKYIILIVVVLTMQACSNEVPNKSDEKDLSMNVSSQESHTTNSTEPSPELNTDNEVKDVSDSSQESNTDYVEKDLFMYDSSKELNVTELSVSDKEGVQVNEISYDAYDTTINADGKVTAYLVVPEGEGPFPAVIYFHWLGNSNSNKNEFLQESVEMAQKGVVGFLINGYFPWRVKPNGTDKDMATIIYQVIELRRVIDYISSLPYVDSKNLAYVGHDYGAMFGAVLSGVDKRIGSYNLIAGMGNFAKWFLKYWVQNNTDEYLKGLSALDPVNYIGKADSCKFFFQFANKDVFITEKEADMFYEAGSQPKEVKFYDIDHKMNLDEVKADRMKWLSDCLGVN